MSRSSVSTPICCCKSFRRSGTENHTVCQESKIRPKYIRAYRRMLHWNIGENILELAYQKYRSMSQFSFTKAASLTAFISSILSSASFTFCDLGSPNNAVILKSFTPLIPLISLWKATDCHFSCPAFSRSSDTSWMAWANFSSRLSTWALLLLCSSTKPKSNNWNWQS